jgi:hypothetical protein
MVADSFKLRIRVSRICELDLTGPSTVKLVPLAFWFLYEYVCVRGGGDLATLSVSGPVIDV